MHVHLIYDEYGNGYLKTLFAVTTEVYFTSLGPSKSWNNFCFLSNLKNEYTAGIYALLRPR